MENSLPHTILLFIDGLGWGASDPQTNPQCAYGGEFFAFPSFPVDDAGLCIAPAGGRAHPIDAVLGVKGVPQSATGQTTLLTGKNAQERLGRHLTGFPNEELRKILLEYSLLRRLTDAGLEARFLNAFRPRFFELPRRKQLQFSATTVANLAGNLPFFTLADVDAGRSVYQEFTNRDLIERGFRIEPMTPAQAGCIVARSSREYDFTLYEYFQTDRAGHRQEMDQCCEQLGRLDAFLAALLEELPDDTLVLLTSDHGNLEDLTTRRHTTNPVPLAAWGNGAAEFVAGIHRLDQVAGAVLLRHGVDDRPTRLTPLRKDSNR